MRDETTYKILKAIDENPTQSQRDLSKSLGYSLGKLNYSLKALKEKGWVKANNIKQNSHKSNYLYSLTPAGIEAKAKVTLSFLKRKKEEYEVIKKEIARLQVEIR